MYQSLITCHFQLYFQPSHRASSYLSPSLSSGKQVAYKLLGTHGIAPRDSPNTAMGQAPVVAVFATFPHSLDHGESTLVKILQVALTEVGIRSAIHASAK
jgi:hypothetical protein